MDPNDGARAIRDTAAERLVLCGVLKACDLVLPHLAALGVSEACFCEWRHRLVWRAALDLYNAGRDVGPHAVYLALAFRRELEELGCGSRPHQGAAGWLAELWDEDPTGAWAVPAAHRLLAAAARLDAYHRAREVIRDALDGCRGPDYFRRFATA